MEMGVASGEDARSESVPAGPHILGGDWCQARCGLHETLLGASPEEHILKEREGPCSLCNYLCGQDSHTGAQP